MSKLRLNAFDATGYRLDSICSLNIDAAAASAGLLNAQTNHSLAPPAPVRPSGRNPQDAPDKELKALVFDSLFAFNKAVQEKSFAKFHEERLSSQFQKQFPLKKFTGIFQTFIDKGYDISNIAKSRTDLRCPTGDRQ